MIWLIAALFAASFIARYGLFYGILAALIALALLPFVLTLAIPGFLVLAGTLVALGG
jgi:hypothetical protein